MTRRATLGAIDWGPRTFCKYLTVRRICLAKTFAAPSWRRWWMAGPIFVGIELAVHAIIALRGRPNFYRGDG
jgi:hypothetical protein